MAKPADSRTERATPKKRRDARERGEAARSTELPQAITLVVAVAMLSPALASMWERLRADSASLVGGQFTLDAQVIGRETGAMLRSAAMTLVPLLVLVIAVSVITQLGLSGRPNPWKLKPKLDPIKPKNGLKRIFSRQQLWELARTMLKLGLLGALAFVSWAQLSDFLALGPAPLTAAFEQWRGVLQTLGVGVALLGVVIGFGDSIISKRNFERNLRMSRQEVKDEMKQMEGDPLIRSQIRQAQQRLSRMRMIAAVADATVVVTNPTHFSVALRYDPSDDAPVVVAKGADEMALRIRAEARRNGVPIRENKLVARTLFTSAEVGQPIPVALYRAVAQLLASIYSVSRSTGALA